MKQRLVPQPRQKKRLVALRSHHCKQEPASEPEKLKRYAARMKICIISYAYVADSDWFCFF